MSERFPAAGGRPRFFSESIVFGARFIERLARSVTKITRPFALGTQIFPSFSRSIGFGARVIERFARLFTKMRRSFALLSTNLPLVCPIDRVRSTSHRVACSIIHENDAILRVRDRSLSVMGSVDRDRSTIGAKESPGTRPGRGSDSRWRAKMPREVLRLRLRPPERWDWSGYV